MLIYFPILNILVNFYFFYFFAKLGTLFSIWLVEKLSPTKYLLDVSDHNLHNPKPAKICGWEENLFITVIISQLSG